MIFYQRPKIENAGFPIFRFMSKRDSEPSQIEAVRAGMEKRAPVFADPVSE